MSWIRCRSPNRLNLVLSSAFLLLTTACAQAEPNADFEPALEEQASGEMVDAQAVLAAGLAKAAETDRLVFLHSGAEWCGWCKRMEAWMVREDIAPIFFKDFVDVKIGSPQAEWEIEYWNTMIRTVAKRIT